MSRSHFGRRLAESHTDPGGRRWLYVAYDQLSDAIGPLSREDPDDLGIVLVETAWKASLRPYHRQKLGLVLSNQRHFALEQAARGVAVRYVGTDGPVRPALADVAREVGRLRMMRPAERELRHHLAPLVTDGTLEVIDHEGWLTTREQFERSQGTGPPWRMDAFYRLLRRETGLLMDGDRPEGGRYSLDAENRKSWRGDPPAPEPPHFPVDDVTAEVAELIETRFAHHPGRIDPAALPCSREDAASLWSWARDACLPSFGPYEDAMSRRSAGLFHTRISPLLNLHRLLPADVIRDVIALDIPLASKEGFVRQVLGWREFVRHVHEATDGFRSLSSGHSSPVAKRTGDGGLARWRGERWPGSAGDAPEYADGGAVPSALGAKAPLPPAYWGAPSGLACLDRVVAEVWDTGWTHHIQRLMILSNLATLLDASPRELTDWFWVAFVDAFDWVVEPNVLGMGTYAVGDLMTTKPYVSGAAYISRMSDDCDACRFSPAEDCPITGLYWAFLDRHRQELAGNPRMRLPLASEARREPEQRARDAETYRHVRSTLHGGRELVPEGDCGS